MTYPTIVIAMVIFVVIALMLLVMPVFSKVYSKMNIILPAPTRILIWMSDNSLYIFPALIVLIIILYLSYKKACSTPAMKFSIDRAKMSTPIIGKVYHKIALLRFIRTLGLMLKAGLSLSEGLTIAKGVASNEVAAQAASMIQRSINSGRTVTHAVSLHNFFPKSTAFVFAAGERAGKLGDTLNKIASVMETEVDDEIKSLINKIEPVVTVILSLVVGFVLMAIYLPIFDLIKSVRA